MKTGEVWRIAGSEATRLPPPAKLICSHFVAILG